ncbi:MAG: hypothetical protein HFF61_12855 [Oscillospiraceae bacterium]|nr:hypothetical protein [Oscillospiraceae bacterium]
MEHTENYQLSQWAKQDRIQMQDFNADNQKLDTALKAEADARAAETSARQAVLDTHTAQIAKLGNCQIYTTTYKGTGNNSENFGASHPNRLTFPKKPALVMIFTEDGQSQMNIFPINNTYVVSTSNRSFKVNITWTGNTVTWYADDVFLQMNWLSYTYRVVAIYSMD